MITPFSISELTERTFGQRVLQSELPVLVAVCLNGSGASQRLLKLLEEWGPQTHGRLNIFRWSADGLSELTKRFGVPLAPGLMLFSRGALCYQFIGEVSRRELDELLARVGTQGVSVENPSTSEGCIVERPLEAN
jgi:thioredoxin-like negative regulator of GroEL